MDFDVFVRFLEKVIFISWGTVWDKLMVMKSKGKQTDLWMGSFVEDLRRGNLTEKTFVGDVLVLLTVSMTMEQMMVNLMEYRAKG